MQHKGGLKSDAMGQLSIWKLLIRFSGPAIISMTVGGTYDVVDAIFVGRLGTESLAAIGLAFPMMLLFMAVSIGTGVGAASLISRKLGSGEKQEADRAACVTITLSIILGGIVPAVCLPYLDDILGLLGASGTILPLARSYISILIVFAVVNFFALIFGNVIRAEGSPRFPSAVFIISAVTNIALDPVFIYGLNMGVRGAAIATVIARSVGAILFILYFVLGKTSFKFRLGYFLPKLKIIAEIYRIGLASMVRMIAMSLVMFLGNRVALSFDESTLSVFIVLIRIYFFIYMPVSGLGQGILPLIGYNYGAKKMERVGEVLSKAGKVALIWSAICLLTALLIPTQLMSIFNSSDEFLRFGTDAIKIGAIGFVFLNWRGILAVFFQGIGNAFASLALAISAGYIFVPLGLLLLPGFLERNGLWLAFPIADFLTFSVAIIWALIVFRRIGTRFHWRYPAK